MKSLPYLISNAKERVIRRLRRKNYAFAKAYYQREIHRSSLQYTGPSLLIYQMGKVGSVTVRRSLKALELDMPIYHTHFLTRDIIDKEEEKRKKYFGTFKTGDPGWQDPKRPWLNQYLRRQIKGSKDKRWKVVTLVREPVGRNLSAFFEGLEFTQLDSGHQYRVRSILDFETILDLENLEPFMATFFEKFDHDTPLMFFDREFKSVLGIDIFAQEFPKSKGYGIYEEELADVLVIRLEDLNKCARDAFRDFLGINDFELVMGNIAADKSYRTIYRKFLKALVVSESYINRMYESKYAQHFYSAAEINKFRAKWRKENAAQQV